eukprot:15462229-Alexandrium_andersonii.AAC.1
MGGGSEGAAASPGKRASVPLDADSAKKLKLLTRHLWIGALQHHVVQYNVQCHVAWSPPKYFSALWTPLRTEDIGR